jgi:hypothetical protein
VIGEEADLGAGVPPATPRQGEAPLDPRTAGMAAVSATLTVLYALSTPTIPWHAGPALLVLAGIAWGDRAWTWPAIGAAAVWAPVAAAAVKPGAGAGPVALAGAGAAFAVAALVADRRDSGRRAVVIAILLAGLAIAAKQQIAATVLPAAAALAPWVLATTGAAAGAVALARGRRVEAVALGVAGGVVLARLGAVWTLDGVPRLDAAARLHAVPLVYDALALSADPALAAALVRAAPDRDAAALALGWEAALDIGWRPYRADGVVIPVARALDAAGRGGEALRLLARHPREGDVDALRALLERVQGAPDRWRGATLGEALPGRFDPALRFDTGGWAGVEFTARTALAGVTLQGEGTPYAGAPVLEVRLDGGPPTRWALDGPATLALPGPIAAGPHRLDLFFVNDRADAGGDRNAVVRSVEGR